jgi:hypothetical protein
MLIYTVKERRGSETDRLAVEDTKGELRESRTTFACHGVGFVGVWRSLLYTFNDFWCNKNLH